jgi:DNA-binding NarL/FixJ family response regulator
MAPTDAMLTALLIEDQRDIREGLRVLINGTSGYRCTGAFGSIEDALTLAASEPPQVILLDIGLPGLSGLEGIPLLRARYPSAAILILTVYEDDDRIFRALCAGAAGYLLKKTPPARLLESLREAVDGGAPMSLEVARKVITLFRQFQPPERADYNLSPHEMRLLKLLSDGHNYKTAAGKLALSINTVSFHMRRIYEKLHVHSKSEAVAKALRSGILR